MAVAFLCMAPPSRQALLMEFVVGLTKLWSSWPLRDSKFVLRNFSLLPTWSTDSMLQQQMKVTELCLADLRLYLPDAQH